MLKKPTCLALMEMLGISSNIWWARFIMVDLPSLAAGKEGTLNSLRRSGSSCLLWIYRGRSSTRSVLNRGVSRCCCRSPKEFKKLVTNDYFSSWSRKLAWHRVSDIQLEGNWNSTIKVKPRILPSISDFSILAWGDWREVYISAMRYRVPTSASQNNQNASLVTPSPTPSSLSKSTPATKMVDVPRSVL